MELLNDNVDPSAFSLPLTDLFIEEFTYTGYYDRSIGDASNLAVGDVIYSDSNLATGLNTSGGNNTYNQFGTGSTTTHCTFAGGYILVMVLNSSSAITSISCQQV